MNPKRLIKGTGAAVLVAAGLQAGGVAHAQALTPAQAGAAARNHVVAQFGNGAVYVLEVDLEREWGRVAYEVEVRRADGREVEVLVDAANGAVLATEVDDD